MFNPLDSPLLVLVLSLPVFWAAAWIGASFREKRRDEASRDDLGFIVGATLTLLGLIIAFTFSMAVNRYDQRKSYEEQEANAIGTEYVRASLLPAAEAAKVRAFLISYLDQRILYYEARGDQQLSQIDAQTARLQTEMWSAVATAAAAQPSPVTALVVAGMNDVLNAQGYTQAAWWNRIPIAAWILLMTISIFCNLLVGYSLRGRTPFRFLILPITLSVSLFLIADIDSPRHGVIRVPPQNIESLAKSLHSQ